jgi:hypothetical protein
MKDGKFWKQENVACNEICFEGRKLNEVVSCEQLSPFSILGEFPFLKDMEIL